MSKNQSHGILLEQKIKSHFTNEIISQNGIWDIPKEYDNKNNLNSSVKSTGSDTIHFADARRFWGISETWRLFVFSYNQLLETKEIFQLNEFIITPKIHSDIISGISVEEITEFHSKLVAFKKGQHVEARNFAKKEKQKYLPKVIILNPKIDSKNQRRLQCSMSLMELTTLCPSIIYDSNFPYTSTLNQAHSIIFPFFINSGPREFN